MSQLNGLGPNNQGPITGRGLGNCNGGSVNRSFFGKGRGFGAGRGCGIGYGRMFLTQKETKEELEAYKKQLEAEITAINEELGSN